MHTLLLFLDGVGIGEKNPNKNPFFASQYHFLTKLLGGRLPSISHPYIESKHALCIPTNATLYVSGLPQSGTGQATLYTGVNCAKKIGKHFGPYIYSALKPILKEHNIFHQIQKSNKHKRVALANAFPQKFFDYINNGATRIVAGVYAALECNILLRTHEHLLNGTAVSTDITAERWRAFHHPDAPIITPYEAGKRLANITQSHHFTLFEYFFTDKAGHEQDMTMSITLLQQIDQLLAGLIDHCDLKRTLICVTSDHGNIEDLTTKPHTRNRVPTILIGKNKNRVAQKIRSITHITPALVRTTLN